MFVKGVIEAENLEDDVVHIAFSLNFKMLYNDGEMVCGATTLGECERISLKRKGDVPESPPAPKIIRNVNDDIQYCTTDTMSLTQ